MDAERNLERELLEALGPAWRELVPAAAPPDGFADGVLAAKEEPMHAETARLELNCDGSLAWPKRETDGDRIQVGLVGPGRRRRAWLLLAACLALVASAAVMSAWLIGPAPSTLTDDATTTPLQAVGARVDQEAFEQAVLAGALDTAREAFAEARYADAEAGADRVLQVAPDHRAAAALKRQAEARLSRQTTGGDRTGRSLERAENPPAQLLTGKALELYLAGDLDALRNRATELEVSADALRALRRFEAFKRQGEELSENVSQITKAYRQDAALGGGGGKLRQELRRRLAKAHFSQGVDAQARRKYLQAYRDFTQAREYYPDLGGVNERLRDLAREAKKLYEKAYVLKRSRPDRALEHCRTVMGMIDPSHVYYTKSRKLADRIEQGMFESPRQDGGF